MADSPDKIKWHPAFCAATQLEMRDDADMLDMKPEYYLSKEPIRIDLLIIKDEALKNGIKNEIGHIMRKYNIIEYKSPADGLNIDDYYKTIGYASLYKGYGKTTNSIPADEITVSLFRAKKPPRLLKILKDSGHTIVKKSKGIYYVTGNVLFPTQIVVTSELDERLHSSLRILSDNVSKDDVKNFLYEHRNDNEQGILNDIKAVLKVSTDANKQVYEEVRRHGNMGSLWDEWFEEAERKGEARGEARGEKNKQNMVIMNMFKKNYTLPQIAEIVDMSVDAVKKIIDSNMMKA